MFKGWYDLLMNIERLNRVIVDKDRFSGSDDELSIYVVFNIICFIDEKNIPSGAMNLAKVFRSKKFDDRVPDLIFHIGFLTDLIRDNTTRQKYVIEVPDSAELQMR